VATDLASFRQTSDALSTERSVRGRFILYVHTRYLVPAPSGDHPPDRPGEASSREPVGLVHTQSHAEGGAIRATYGGGSVLGSTLVYIIMDIHRD
jgi:hypothetical protein